MTSRDNSIVFQSGTIGSLKLKNRLVRSATFESAATLTGDTGQVTDAMLEIHRNLAKGGVGLIIMGIVGVYSKCIGHGQMRLDDDKYIKSFEQVAKAVHEIDNECKIMPQLHHYGRQSIRMDIIDQLIGTMPGPLRKRMKEDDRDLDLSDTHASIEVVAPSALYDDYLKRTPRELELEEVEEIIDAFAEAIRRSQEAGFDGVQLHAAHGWLLSSFMSPLTNKRTDKYGGSVENRVRMVKEIHDRARKKVGADFPILIKYNTTDFYPGGIDMKEALEVGKMLSDIGFDALEVSGGAWVAVTRSQEDLGWKPVLLPESRTEINKREKEAYFREAARIVKEAVSIPVITVGGLRSFDLIEEIIEKGDADFAALSRPLVRQPDLPNLWQTGQGNNKARCISCNGCVPGGEDLIPLKCRMKK